MASDIQKRAIDTYAGLMEEIKFRFSAIDAALDGSPRLNNGIVQEVCYLQLRMICETIAIGCLVAHGDIVMTNGKLRKEWAADRIIQQLAKLHKSFYPEPFVMKEEKDGSRTLTPAEPGYLTQRELISLYHECGSRLHRGNIKSLEVLPSLSESWPAEIRSYKDRIRALLGRHLLFLLDANIQFICLLWNSSDQGRVQVAIVEASE